MIFDRSKLSQLGNPYSTLVRRRYLRSRVHFTQVKAKTAGISTNNCHCSPSKLTDDLSSLTDYLLQTVPGGRAKSNLEAADQFWRGLCTAEANEPKQVIFEVAELLQKSDGLVQQDIVILGGTLGIFLGTALQLRGKSVTVVERGLLLGRDQEWNIGREDMQAFMAEGLLTTAEIEEVIVSEFNPVRVAFEGISEIVTKDILNCGVSPKRLLELLKKKFLANGGKLMEGTSFECATVHPNGTAVHLSLQDADFCSRGSGGAGGEGNVQLEASSSGRSQRQTLRLRAEVLVDAMGSFSPIAQQSRKGRKPDSVVLMVGSCAQGLPECSTADLLYSFTPLNRKRKLQYFWEAFPARDGLTTYMFCYTDPHPGRATLRQLFEDYVELLPKYRGCKDLEGVSLRRAQFGVVPNWHDSPLKPATSRLLHIGDSAGNRSALSFAGFGAMARHLRRLRVGLEEALELGLTDLGSLQLLQPSSPAIAMTAAMQFSMGTRQGQKLEEFSDEIINEYIGGSFQEMKKFGPTVYRPFMQDYLQWGSLSRIVGNQLLTQPKQLIQMTLFMRSPQAGQMFASNFAKLFLYDLLFQLAKLVAPVHEALLPPKLLFRWHRLVEAFEYGSANDYKDEGCR